MNKKNIVSDKKQRIHKSQNLTEKIGLYNEINNRRKKNTAQDIKQHIHKFTRISGKRGNYKQRSKAPIKQLTESDDEFDKTAYLVDRIREKRIYVDASTQFVGTASNPNNYLPMRDRIEILSGVRESSLVKIYAPYFLGYLKKFYPCYEIDVDYNRNNDVIISDGMYNPIKKTCKYTNKPCTDYPKCTQKNILERMPLLRENTPSDFEIKFRTLRSRYRIDGWLDKY